ncbi:uncharacterized protein LOC126825274 [Patella vulgata]|uniref:uncharacterized protein LOC126825274 n=1 Tax=Patella vulgata TaxID=6465 RepID=UPI00217FE208|nr:uncharacterized protein LOC126825274 [Patella vulgata]
MTVANQNIQMKCSSINVYDTCLKNAEPLCSPDEKATIQNLLSSEVIPVLTNQCGQTVAATSCLPLVQNCTTAWKAAMATANQDLDKQCAAVLVYGSCLKNAEPSCSADDKASIETLLNKEVLPILSNQCQAQACDVEFAECTQAWKTATGQSTSKPETCKLSEEYMSCLLSIESTCTPKQVTDIRSILNQLGPQVNRDCRGQDCSVQTNMCIAVWNVSLAETEGTLPLICNANELFDVCLRAIEVDCSAAEKTVITQLVDKITPTLYSKCKGYGCTPMLYECTNNVNTSLQLATTTQDKCSTYQVYEQCLTNTEVLCNGDEKSTVNNDLKIIHPLIQTLCNQDSGVTPLKAWLLSTILLSLVSTIL